MADSSRISESRRKKRRALSRYTFARPRRPSCCMAVTAARNQRRRNWGETGAMGDRLKSKDPSRFILGGVPISTIVAARRRCPAAQAVPKSVRARKAASACSAAAAVTRLGSGSRMNAVKSSLSVRNPSVAARATAAVGVAGPVLLDEGLVGGDGRDGPLRTGRAAPGRPRGSRACRAL